MREADLKSHIIELAKWHGWLIHHDLPALDKAGNWRTHIEGHAGFPDLVLAHPQRGLVFAELKAETGKASLPQAKWLAGLEGHTAEAYLWYPGDMKEIEARLALR
jgi:hypothetical protein